ncbi:hypothetical protein WHZ78_17595 [Bradyrhizobium symbiodeficiens]|uniref:hypothetical protein n=1 Tax=Bradyrhizobium symbiodeficiens TaxID=1404367 RepID=UPI0030CF36A2
MGGEGRDESTGQFAEPKFGLAAEEAKAGYSQMPELGSEPEKPKEFESAEDAADSLTDQQSPAIPVVYFDAKTGERLNSDLEQGAVETVTVERAAKDLAAYRQSSAESAAKSISEDFAAAIDQLRTGDEAQPSEPIEKTATPEKSKSDEPAVDDPTAAAIDAMDGLAPETKQALKNPQIRAALQEEFGKAQQVQDTFNQALSTVNSWAQASFFESVPELAGLPADQLEHGLALLAQVDPPRFQAAMGALNRVNQIQTVQQQEQQRQAHIAHQQFEAQRIEYGRKSDEALGAMTPREKAEMAEELVQYVAEYGISREQFIGEARTNLALHHPAFQKMAADAVRYQRIVNGPKPTPRRSVPPVQKPGNGGVRVSASEATLAELSRQFASATGDNQLRLAAKISTLRRAKG